MSNNTHRNIVVPTDKKNNSADLPLQWLLEPDKATKQYQFPISTKSEDNEIKVLICGKEGFDSIYADILAAKKTVDLICWGFDPGMPLIRKGGGWRKENSYGELLKAKANSGVTIRLLVWYNPRASAKQQNLIGYSAPNLLFPSSGPDLRSHQYTELTEDDLRQNYCIHWWNEALSGLHPHLQVRCRDGDQAAVIRSLSTNEDPPDDSSSGIADWIDSEKSLLEKYATHHQKPILIDYGVSDKQGDYGVGYIMGLNSISDFWDTTEHLFDDPLREPDWNASSHTSLCQITPPKVYMDQATVRPLSREPYQDYAARLRGGVLAGVHTNFVQAWSKASALAPRTRYTRIREELSVFPDMATAVKENEPFKANSKPPLQLQVLRTQPQENTDQSIKTAYRHVSEQAQTYLFIENQYFFYERWVRELLDSRKSFTAGVQRAGWDKIKHPVLHLIAVLPWPEDTGMVPRTYTTLKMLGTGDSMPGQRDYVKKSQDKISRETRNSPSVSTNEAGELQLFDSAAALRAQLNLSEPQTKLFNPQQPFSAAPAPTFNFVDQAKFQQALGMKSLFCRMVSYNSQGIKDVHYVRTDLNKEQIGKEALTDKQVMYRQIYIHSKLLIADDVYFTLGSANLNQRSMAVDSEINVACASQKEAGDLRQRVWTLMTKGYKACVPDGLDQEKMAYAYSDWKILSNLNQKKMNKKAALVSGFLVSFQDTRHSSCRHA